jgi:predicted metal-binding protein
VTKVGIIICGRYQSCSGGKCFRALHERAGAFAAYAKDDEVQIVGYSHCGGCPGGNVEYLPAEMKKNGVDIIHLATGLVVGYPPCQYVRQFKSYIEKVFNIPVRIGTHPIPRKYFETHQKLTFWKELNMEDIAGDLLKENPLVMENYN